MHALHHPGGTLAEPVAGMLCCAGRACAMRSQLEGPSSLPLGGHSGCLSPDLGERTPQWFPIRAVCAGWQRPCSLLCGGRSGSLSTYPLTRTPV